MRFRAPLDPRPWPGIFGLSVLLLSLLRVSGLSAQAVLTVNTTDDTDDGVCDAAHCSLREAMNTANAAAEGAIIAFDIPGPGPHTIQPLSNLPLLWQDITIDGTTEPDFTGSPIIELDGTLAGGFAQGLNVAGSQNTLRGLVVNRFSDVGISIGAGATENTVEGCFVGTDVTGSVALGNGNIGILIGQSSDNTIGGTTQAARNLVSGNPEGITILDEPATGNVISGNFIGTDVTGTVAVPNGVGVVLLAPDNVVGGTAVGAGNLISGNQGNGVGLGPPNASGNVIVGNFIGVNATGDAALGNDVGVFVNDVAGNTVGGTSAGARNVISGNREGVTLWDDGATGTLVQGNYIGTNATGDAAIPNEIGVPVYSPGNTIGGTEAGAGNLISGNRINGVNLYGEYATGNAVQGNLIGTDATGETALGNGENGVFIGNSAADNTIGGTEAGAGNVISGNGFGVLIGTPDSDGNTIQGNFIGTDATGAFAVPNLQTGILLWSHNTIIGGSEAGAGNVISGNGFAGIDMGGGSGGTTIQGNHIGTDATGTTALGNDLGIFVNFSFDNVIGGTTAGARNLISGNVSGSVTINGVDATGNVLRGNYIGTDVTGTAELGNGRGIQVLDAPDNTIGGTASGAGNLISANMNGVLILGANASGNLIEGNTFGTDATGLVPLGNRGATIRVSEGASNNIVGGTDPGAGNVIANSGWHGIALFGDAGTGNRILSNSIFDNGSLGIEMGRNGPDTNDDLDADTGPNNFQNYPVLTSVVSGSGAVIQATLNSVPSSSFTVDFFSNPSCDESGFGEGKTPLGIASLTTDAAGTGTVSAAFSSITGTLLTATATDADGNTSEFSQCGDLTTLGVSSSPTSRTVLQGQSTQYAIGVSAGGGAFDKTVTLSCSGAPSQATCAFDQDQVMIADGLASATMTVSTAAPAAAPPVRPGPSGGPRGVWWIALVLLASNLAGMLTRNGGKRPEPEHGKRPFPGERGWFSLPLRLRWTVLGVAGGLVILMQAACGKDGTSPPTGGTPTGTYELTVTAAWESAQTTTTVTLVVQ